MGRLAQGGREPSDLDPLDLEGLSDPIPDSKFPGNGIEDRERSGREGSVDGVDPKGGRGPKRITGIRRSEVADGPVADLADLGVPVRFPIVEADEPDKAMVLLEGSVPVSWGTFRVEVPDVGEAGPRKRIRLDRTAPVPATV